MKKKLCRAARSVHGEEGGRGGGDAGVLIILCKHNVPGRRVLPADMMSFLSRFIMNLVLFLFCLCGCVLRFVLMCIAI